jgi:flagellar P-ring protein FlgI
MALAMNRLLVDRALTRVLLNRALTITLALALAALAAAPLHAQSTRVRDLVTIERDVPVRLMGYGIVVGLDGTGDRAMGTHGSPHTVRAVTNLLHRFGIDVPAELLRTRNVAAVLVTAEASAYLRQGSRFDVTVASVGDAVSLRGGMLWSTPLTTGPNAPPLATAQGAVVLSQGMAVRNQYNVETSAVIPSGGLFEAVQERPATDGPSRLLLREPDLGTAVRMAAAINTALGADVAAVEDPGSVRLEPPADEPLPTFLGRVSDVRMEPDRAARVIIDSRDGTVVAGADITVGAAVVSHGTLTLAIGSTVEQDVPGSVRVPTGTAVQDVAVALHAVAATPAAIAAVFRSLYDVGALSAQVVIR